MLMVNNGGCADVCATGRFSGGKHAMTKISMTVDEAVSYCGIGRTKLYEFFKEGRLRPRKCGRRTLVLVAELDALIRSLPVAA